MQLPAFILSIERGVSKAGQTSTFSHRRSTTISLEPSFIVCFILVFPIRKKIDAFFILILYKKVTAAGEGESCLQ